jgi:hypothetical protein
MADERVTAAADSTATSERHISMAYSGIGNKNAWTRVVLAGGGAVAFSVRIGRIMVPKTPSSLRRRLRG